MRAAALLFALCACGAPPNASPSGSTEPPRAADPPSVSPAPLPARRGAPPALPAQIEARVGLPGAADQSLRAQLNLDGLPWTVTGCVLPSSAAECAAPSRVELDDAGRRELVTLLAEVSAIPRCEPEPVRPGDRAYRLAPTGGRVYEGQLPAAEADLAVRNAGACRADARLAWWIAAKLRSASPASGSDTPDEVDGGPLVPPRGSLLGNGFGEQAGS